MQRLATRPTLCQAAPERGEGARRVGSGGGGGRGGSSRRLEEGGVGGGGRGESSRRLAGCASEGGEGRGCAGSAWIMRIRLLGLGIFLAA